MLPRWQQKLFLTLARLASSAGDFFGLPANRVVERAFEQLRPRERRLYAGLLDRCIARPSATYPHELFCDTSNNLYLKRNFSLADCYDPPARWTSCPIEVAAPPCPAQVKKESTEPGVGWIEFRSKK